ncbi:DUF5667 domain-containing protein [Chloroflexus sp.]|uniref:DUF5667 domain-containing protein n=1 Tax=Chloroflexus sp. TaxID=1904827 RepID=UPI002ACDB7AD|nr:DUF5667 domain-containing protein [Chloroflexus sp.]
MPGEPLYPIKRSIEQVQLTLSGNSEQLKTSFAARRRYEVTALLAQSRAAEVEFHGTLELMSAERWQVSSILVMISDTTRIQGQPALGAVLIVHGRTTNDTVQAEVIIVLGANDPGNNAGEPAHATLEPTPTASLAVPTATITMVPPAPTTTATLFVSTPTEWATSTPATAPLPVSPVPSATPTVKPGSTRNRDGEVGPRPTPTAEPGRGDDGGAGGPNPTPTAEPRHSNRKNH